MLAPESDSPPPAPRLPVPDAMPALSAAPYLIFDGRARDAMEAYARALGGTLTIKTFGEMPPCDEPVEGVTDPTPAVANRVLHASLVLASGVCLFASDVPASKTESAPAPGSDENKTDETKTEAETETKTEIKAAAATKNEHAPAIGDNISVCLGYADLDEGKRVFDALLREGEGEVTMAFARTFWSPGYGTLKDKFGVNWMVNVDDTVNAGAAATEAHAKRAKVHADAAEA